jgi:DnaJ-class molecular chaperone
MLRPPRQPHHAPAAERAVGATAGGPGERPVASCTGRRSPSESSAVTAVDPPPLKDGLGEQKRVGRHFFLVESAVRACGGYGSQAQHHCVVVAGQGSSAARNLHVPPAGSDQTNW